jgi:hypothetical protein
MADSSPRHSRVVMLAATAVSLLHRLVLLRPPAELFVLETIGTLPREIAWAVLAGSESWLHEVEHLVVSAGCRAVFMPVRPLTAQALAELDQRTMRTASSRIAQNLARLDPDSSTAGEPAASMADARSASVLARVLAAREALRSVDDGVIECHQADREVPMSLRGQREVAVAALDRLHEESRAINGGTPELWPF